MKKIVSLVIGIFSIAMVSCSNTKVLEENTKENDSLDKYKVTERNVEYDFENKIFMPIFYNEYGVNGILESNKLGIISEEEDNILCIVSEDGEFKKESNNLFTKENLVFIKSSAKNICRDISEEFSTGDKEFYYIDLMKNIKIKLDDYEDRYFKIVDEYKSRYTTGFAINDDYYVNIDEPLENGKPIGIQNVSIVDIKNNIFYTSDSVEIKSYYYYDDKEKSVMAIDLNGDVSKIIFKNGKINFEAYKNIDLKGVNGSCLLRPSYRVGDNVILKFEDRNDVMVDAVYNIYSNEVSILNNKNTIISNIENTNYLLVKNNNGVFISDLDISGNLNLIYKLEDGENYNRINAKANKEGDSIFLTYIKYDISEGKASYVKDVRYSFIDIEEK